jgi:5'-methylthioadenosine phosphorylase
MNEPISLAIIGGSGLYTMPGLKDPQEYILQTPFGETSAPIIVGSLEGKRIAFLARHGIGHTLMPSEVPYRANIFALKSLGVERILSINACGSLREDYAPGHIVLPDQLFDHTSARPRSFFGDGMVAHVSVADPFCPDLSASLLEAMRTTGATVHQGGSLIIIEGPRFSTKAESNVYRSWMMSIIGMTAVPEAFLAREAEICYTVMAHVTDYDVWHVSEAPVSVEMVINTLNENTKVAQAAIRNLLPILTAQPVCTCRSALASAIITQPAAITAQVRERLQMLIGKYLQ